MKSSSDPVPPRPGLRQIAAAAEVSPMTVSRAMRNDPYVKPEVKSRVLTVAKELGYRPDPTLAKMMGHLRQRKKSGYVATIAGITGIPEHLDPHPLRRVREGARARAEELGYRLELIRISSSERPNPALQRSLRNKGIDGVLLFQMLLPTAVDELLDWSKFSVVTATPSVLSPHFPSAGVDYYSNARMLCAVLDGKGFRRIGFVGPRTFGVRTNDAFISAISREALNRDEAPVRPFVLDGRKVNREKFETWLQREKPDAIVLHSDDALPSILDIPATAKRRPPPPVFCTSVDPANAPCPGIDERLEHMGREAVDALSGLLHRNEKNLQGTGSRTLISGRWFEPFVA